MEKKKMSNVCLNVEVTQAMAPMELPSRFGEGTFKTVRISMENGHVLQDVEGGKYYNLFCRIQAGDVLSYEWDRQESARVGKSRTTTSGADVIPAYNGNLVGVDITDVEAFMAEEKFAAIMGREAKEARKYVAPVDNSVPEFKPEGEVPSGPSSAVDDKLKALG